MIQIKKYEYNSRCDMAGCSNMAKWSVSKPSQNPGQRLNICEDCLKEIVQASKDAGIISPDEIKEVIKEVEVVKHDYTSTFDKFTVPELKSFAKALGIQGYSLKTKEELIKDIEEYKKC